MHNFLVLLQCDAPWLHSELSQIVGTLECLSPLVITHEISHEGSLRFSKNIKIHAYSVKRFIRSTGVHSS